MTGGRLVQVEGVVSDGLHKAMNNYNDTVMKEQMDFVQTEVSAVSQ